MSSSLHLVSAPSLPDPVEAELAKDIWDVRRLPGVRYAQHRSDHLLNFTHAPLLFRPVLKRYFRLQITRYSFSECSGRLRSLRLFLEFYLTLHPTARDFQQLSRTDIERYLTYLKTGTNSYGRPNSKLHIWLAVTRLQHFLEYLERTSSPEAPSIAITKLIWPEDSGTFPQSSAYSNEIKYIPETVLYQLEQHMHQLPPVYLPVVIVLRASGWRISDVLNLRYDTCLEHTSSGWWLCGDILKTDVLNHKVPITEDVAKLIMAQCVNACVILRPNNFDPPL